MSDGIKDLVFLTSVNERDIDLLVLEELHANTSFCKWFAERLYGDGCFRQFITALHSVADAQHGESDLIFLFEHADNGEVAILIENKINAGAQENQAGRYRVRGEKGKNNGDWQEYRTCIIAPQAYLTSQVANGDYDTNVTYEEFLAFFSAMALANERAAFRAKVIRQAIDKQKRGFVTKVNEAMTAFGQAYFQYASLRHPDLCMVPVKPRAATNSWFKFRPAGVPENVDLFHQVYGGHLKLFFNGQQEQLDVLSKHFGSLQQDFPDLVFTQTKTTVAIGLPVEVIKPLETPFHAVENIIDQTLNRLDLLLQAIHKVGFPTQAIRT